ncbi:MAG: GGDEF domain-containing phosphodiesterase, partial [Cyanobacteria bacterium J06649_4]
EMAKPVEIRGQKLFPTASIGIAFSRINTASHRSLSQALDAEDLLRDAQTAMSRAKTQGRGRCEVFVQDMRSQLSTRLGLESDLREALARQELLLYYQPLICMKSRKVAGFEALIRWQHPEKGMISPGDFISIAEDTGLIIPIGRWVIETACRQAQQWQQQFPQQAPFMSVNVSGRQFSQKDLVEQIDRILQETGFHPPQLKLELTESVVMDDVNASIEMLLQLKGLNLQLGIDDFGTGYSSLSYLHRFPIDTLKVDRSFVMEMEQSDGTAELVKTIISLGHNLGMNVVAEGIETQSQYEMLKGLRCEYGQGYFFAKPLTVDDAEELLCTEPHW